jgi:hypothetical protein
MPDPAPILEYASPAFAGIEDGAVFSISFDPPPVLIGMMIQLLTGAIGIAGIGLTIFLGLLMISPGFSQSGLILPAYGFIALAVFCWGRAQNLRRLMGFGTLPVKITLANGNLILMDPPQWGLAVQCHPAADVQAVQAEFAGWSLALARLYRIYFTIQDRDTVELRVLVRNLELFHRAIDELQMRVKRCRPSCVSSS